MPTVGAPAEKHCAIWKPGALAGIAGLGGSVRVGAGLGARVGDGALGVVVLLGKSEQADKSAADAR